MDGRTEIHAVLSADAPVIALVGTAVYDAPLVPDNYTGAAISMYLTAPTNGGDSIGIYNNTVNCWGKTYTQVEDMQDAVFNALNRKSYGGNTFFRCSKSVIIPPQNTDGDYNAPVEVLVRIKTGGF